MVYEILIPEGVEVNISDNEVSVKGKLGEVKRKLGVVFIRGDTITIISPE